MDKPEKVYLYPNLTGREGEGIVTLQEYDGSTEYVRKDAFIKRATEWIDKNAFRYVVTRKYQGLDVTGLDSSLAVDFKKALEDMI